LDGGRGSGDADLAAHLEDQLLVLLHRAPKLDSVDAVVLVPLLAVPFRYREVDLQLSSATLSELEHLDDLVERDGQDPERVEEPEDGHLPVALVSLLALLLVPARARGRVAPDLDGLDAALDRHDLVRGPLAVLLQPSGEEEAVERAKVVRVDVAVAVLEVVAV